MTEDRQTLSWLQRVAFAVAPTTLVYYLTGQFELLGWMHARGEIRGRDFINFWSGPHLLLQGRIADIFDPGRYAMALRQIWEAGLAAHVFSYPPSIFPLIAWTGALPYGVALVLWNVMGIAALLAAAWPHSRNPLMAMAILLSPAVLACVDGGQVGLLTGALLIGGCRLIDRKPFLAGVLIGLASFKPQLGLLIPIALCAAGRWRTVGGAALSVAALILAGFGFAGEQGWMLYLTHTVPVQAAYMNHGSGVWRTQTPSPLSAAIAAGLPLAVAQAIQAVCTLGAALLIFRHFRANRQRGIDAMDVLILIAATFIASPYVFHYDMPCLVLALVLASAQRPDLEDAPLWRWGVAALWSAPIVMVLYGIAALMTGVPVLPVGTVLLMGGLAMVWLGAQEQSAPSLSARGADTPSA